MIFCINRCIFCLYFSRIVRCMGACYPSFSRILVWNFEYFESKKKKNHLCINSEKIRNCFIHNILKMFWKYFSDWIFSNANIALLFLNRFNLSVMWYQNSFESRQLQTLSGKWFSKISTKERHSFHNKHIYIYGSQTF